jgi:hypothetical protein
MFVSTIFTFLLTGLSRSVFSGHGAFCTVSVSERAGAFCPQKCALRLWRKERFERVAGLSMREREMGNRLATRIVFDVLSRGTLRAGINEGDLWRSILVVRL